MIGSTFAEGDNDTEPIDPGTAASYMSEARSARRHRFDWSAGPAVRPFATAIFKTGALSLCGNVLLVWKLASTSRLQEVFPKKESKLFASQIHPRCVRPFRPHRLRVVTYWQSVQSAEATFALQKKKKKL